MELLDGITRNVTLIEGEPCPRKCIVTQSTIVWDDELKNYYCSNPNCRWEAGGRPSAYARIAYAHVTQMWIEAVKNDDYALAHELACRQQDLLWDLEEKSA